jgi:hypothetical protein
MLPEGKHDGVLPEENTTAFCLKKTRQYVA